MKKTLNVVFVLFATGLYTADLYAQQVGNASDIAAQAVVVAAGNVAGSVASGELRPPDGAMEASGELRPPGSAMESDGDAASKASERDAAQAGVVAAGSVAGRAADGAVDGDPAASKAPESEAGTIPESSSEDKEGYSGTVPRG